VVVLVPEVLVDVLVEVELVLVLDELVDVLELVVGLVVELLEVELVELELVGVVVVELLVRHWLMARCVTAEASVCRSLRSPGLTDCTPPTAAARPWLSALTEEHWPLANSEEIN
jgi:hypothetical protein